MTHIDSAAEEPVTRQHVLSGSGFNYDAFGLRIISSWPLMRHDDRSPGSFHSGFEADLKIIRAEGLEPWDGHGLLDDEAFAIKPGESGVHAYFGRTRMLFRPGLIQIELGDDEGWDRLRPYLLGTGISISLYQSGMMPHHVAVLDIGERAIAVTGASGEGKSTFAHAFSRASGARILSDDLARVDFTESIGRIHGGFPQLKLCRDAMDAFGLESREHEREPGDRDKYLLPVSANRELSKPLAALVVLKTLPQNESMSFERVRGLACLSAYYQSLYRPILLGITGKTTLAASHVSRLAQTIPVYELRRSRDLGNLSLGVTKVVDGLRSEGRL